MTPERGILVMGGMPYPKLVDLAVESERRGLDFIAYGEGMGSAVFPQLAGFAAATERIKLVSWIVSVFPRSPLLIASGIACVDQISGGRAILGLGASIPYVIQSWHGFGYQKPALRMREYVQIIRGLLTPKDLTRVNVEVVGGGVSFEGKTISVQQAGIDIEPVQPRVPIQIAAVGPHMLRVAGGYADTALLEFISPGYLEHARSLIDGGAREVGRDPAEVKIACLSVMAVGDTTEEAIESLKPTMSLYCAFPVYDSLWTGAGLMDDALSVREAFLQGDRDEANRRVSDRLVTTINIAGTAEECRREVERRIEQFSALGVSMFGFIVPDALDRETAFRRTIDVLAA
jgi:alkanesulfonate monooxygenase SsuD/methylene tetrahydromethanopterin reductase-like flavin-dependent oxidoreductase (luciferase family)